jgi:antitoxin YefM
MDTSYSEFRQNLKKMIDWTASNHAPAFIMSHKQRKAVLLSYEDYCSLEETAYLLKSPVNAQRLLKAVADFGSKKNIKKHALIDDET